MKKDIAYVIDAHSHGSFHEVINLGFLLMISSLYERVVYIADESACDNLMSLMTQCKIDCLNVSFERKKIRERVFKHGSMTKFVASIKIGLLNWFYTFRAPSNADVFFNNFMHFTALFNHFLVPFRTGKLVYLCHAEMELIHWDGNHGLFGKIFSEYLKFVFSFLQIKKNTLFVLLSSEMADLFKTMIHEKNRDRIYGMDHCYIRPECNISNKSLDFDGIRIGLPGAISPERGVDSLKHLLTLVDSEKVMLYGISTISDNINASNFIQLNKSGTRLPYENYTSYVRMMDCYLMLYSLGSYKMTASGALLEAVWNEKPVIAIRNAYFEFMFKKFGPLGIMADSVGELAGVINGISKKDLEPYMENIRIAKKALLPKNVAVQLEKIINS